MKNIILAAALSLTAVGAASAMTNGALSTGATSEVQMLLPGADLSSLTGAQAAKIDYILSNSGKDFSNDLDKRDAVRNVLNNG